MRRQPSLVLVVISIILLSIKPYEACRSVPRDNEQVWMRKKHLLLPSLQWKPVTPPKPNPGTNSALAGAKNFATGLPPRKKSNHLLLPHLQWNSVTPPASNPGTNNAVNSATLGEKNFAATKTRGILKTHLLLPSLWKPVTPPKRNPGTNTALAGAENFASGLPPRMKSNHLLLPSLQWRPVTPPSTNPAHNSIGTVSEQNFAGGKITAHPPRSSKHLERQLPLSHKATS